jgi:hypothetical protein
MTEQASQLEDEIESWKGFPWALRKEDLELWNTMIKEVRDRFGEAVEKSGRTFSTDPFFMALLLVQQRMIRQLRNEFVKFGIRSPDSDETMQDVLD